MSEIQVNCEATPNPNSLKFSWGGVVAENGPFDFPSEKSAEASPMAQVLFQQNGVVGVFLGADFVTVTKHPGVSWELLQVMVAGAIKQHIESDAIIVDDTAAPAQLSADPEDVEIRIQQVLDQQIRPAVAMDGGDVQFIGFNAGVVRLQLIGACNGCPSSTATLKLGIENRLKQEIPEVVEVVPVG